MENTHPCGAVREWSALAVLFDKALLKANICPSKKFPEAKPPKSVQGGPRDDGTVGTQGGAQETGAGSCNEQLSGDQTKNQSQCYRLAGDKMDDTGPICDSRGRN